MFAAGTRITIQGSPDRAEKNACYVSTITFGDGTVLDRYGQRIPAKAAVERVTRLPSGEPNLSGDWAAEQLVMTDPAGRDGTLVPLSRVDTFERGGVPEGQREIPGARGTPEAQTPRTNAPGGGGPGRNSAVALTAAGQAAMEALPQLSRAERSCTPGSIVSDWGGEPVNRIAQAAGTVTIEYGRTGMTRTVHVGHGGASGERCAEQRRALDRPLGERRARRRHGRLPAGRAARLDAAQCAAPRRGTLLGRHRRRPC